MKILIIYHSVYGNTQKIAEIVNKQFLNKHSSRIIGISKASIEDLRNIDLLVIGSPTYGGRPTPEIIDFVSSIPQEVLSGIKVATFDTRFKEEDQKFLLKLLIKTIGYASDKMMSSLISKGGNKMIDPVGFYVIKKDGPLKEGEIDKVVAWAKELIQKI